MQKYKVYINNKPKIITDNWKVFCSNYTLITAAGGLVYNSKNQLLMILRNNKWDLPKGKIEVGENIIECAVREVEEECGVSNLQIIRKKENTYHTYEINGKMILKCTYWFEMHTKYCMELLPQISEGITKAEWINEKDISRKLENTYASIKDVLISK